MTQPKAFDYDAFINDLILLVKRADLFTAQDRTHDSDNFRQWQHEVIDLINRISRQRYRINCYVQHRLFRINGYGSYSPDDQRAQFDRALKDTLNELRLVIENYKRYGDPNIGPATSAADSTRNSVLPIIEGVITEELNWPEGVTLKWLFDKMPANIWWMLLSLLGASIIGSFGAGYWVATEIAKTEYLYPKPSLIPDSTKVVKPDSGTISQSAKK